MLGNMLSPGKPRGEQNNVVPALMADQEELL